MTEQELLKLTPQPKHCMADEFDTRVGAQCPNPRERHYDAWWGDMWGVTLRGQTVRVHLCALHDTYRRNGGNQLGPLVLRAAAEQITAERKVSTPRRKAVRQKEAKEE